MELRGAIILGLVVFSLAVIRCDEREREAARQAVVQSNNAFSTSLYQTLSSEPGNLVLSPLSLAAVMAMVWVGTRGETATQLATGLHLPDNHTQVQTGFKTLLSSLQSTQTVTLEIANKLFIQHGSGVKDTYREAVVDHFHSDVEEVDFNNTETVRTSINQWVEERTHNKIKDLIEEGTLSQDTLLLIVNAIYFQGGWRKPFEESRTSTEPFYLNSTLNFNVTMMHQTDAFPYGEISELDAKALRMFYRGKTDDIWGNDATQSMLLLLPNEVDGLASLEASITTLNLGNIINSLSVRDVVLTLPRFKLEKTLKIKDALSKLGITSIFTAGGDLSGITDANIYVDKVVQKALVEVTEKGTEAAAATFIEIRPASARRYKFFEANHPFLFMILDDTTGTILFMGRVENSS